MKVVRHSLVIISLFSLTQAFAVEEKGLLPEVKLNSSNEDVNTEKAFKSEVLITKAENKAIESLKKIIASKKGSPEEADLQYRLAELYMRRAKSGRFFDMNESSRKKLYTMGIEGKRAQESLKLAIDIYNKIEKQFPRYSDIDSVLFNNALAHSQIKQIERAKDLYNKLTLQHPSSNLVPDALLEVGELYYMQQSFSTALEKFKQIEKYPKSKAYPYGLYKSAWCLYNLKRTDEGIDQLVAVVKFNADTQDEKKYNLRKEALRDLTLFVGETMPPQQLYSFFKKICTDVELGEIVFNLATLFESHSRYKEISIFANDYIEEYPSNDFSSKIYTKLINAEESLKNRQKVIANLKKFGDHCRLQTKDAGKSCGDEFRKISLEISKKWWDIWLKNKQHQEFSKLTEQAFEIILSQEDSKKPDSASRYAYAELLFQLGKYEQAQSNYFQVSLDKGLDKTRSHDAVYGALYSIEKQLDLATKDEAKTELLTAQQKELAERYVKEFPNGEHFESLQFKLGFIAYKQKDFDKALEILTPFTTKSRNAKLKAKAEDIVLDIYNIKQDYKKIIAFSGQIQKSTTDDSRKKYLSQINEEANFAQVQKDSKNLEVEKKIQLLKDFALAHKSSKLGQDSLWQSISLAFANGFDVLGADLSLEYANSYPKDEKSLDAIKESVKAYVDAGYLKKAISTLRDLARLQPAKSIQHLETSCDLLRVNSQSAEARGCYKALLDKVEKNRKAEILGKLIKSFGDKKNGTELESVQNQVLRENIEPYATQILISKAKNLFENKKYTDAFNLSMKINSRPVDSDARAEARLIQAAVLEQEFISQSVKAREDKFSMVLAMKTEKFDKAFTAYSSTIKMSKTDKIQAASLQGIDRLYAHFIEALTTMPIPLTLAAQEQQALRTELVKMSGPFQEKRKDNLAKLRQISKLSASNSESINWAEHSVEKTIEPRLVFPAYEKLTSYLPSSLSDFKTSNSRLSATEKKCDTQKASAQSLGGCIQAKKYVEAEKMALQMTATKDQRPMGLYYLSVIAELNGEVEKALWMIEKAESIEPQVAFFKFQKGKVLYSVEGINSALPYFEKALDIKESAKEIAVMYALKSFSDRDFITASMEFSRLSTDELYNLNVAVLYVESILQKGETNEALQVAKKLSSAQPKNVDLLLEQARIYEEFSLKKDEAIQTYQKAVNMAQSADQRDWLKRKIEFLKTNKNSQISMDVGG